MRRTHPVLAALERWQAKGLLDGELARRLREEALEEGVRTGRRTSQYALAVTGGLVLLVAAGVLGDWLWPLMSAGARAGVLALVGAAVHGGGVVMEDRERWLPASWVLQTAGLLIVLGALIYSEAAWVDASAGGLVVGLIALAAPLMSAPRALDRNPVMPAVHVALAPAFLAVFLDRATPLSADAIVWVLDGVMALFVVFLLVEVRRVAGERPPEEVDRRLYALLVALYAGLVLVVVTAAGPLDLEEDSVWAVNAWWAGLTALALWADQRAPAPLQREWYAGQLAFSVLLAIPLVFWTCLGALDWNALPTALVLGGVGAAAIGHGMWHQQDGVLRSGAIAVVAAAWYFGVESAGALGAVLALLFTAAVLFWISVRVGARAEEDEEVADGRWADPGGEARDGRRVDAGADAGAG